MSKPSTLSWTDPLVIGARTSPLSRAQVKEVSEEIRTHYPQIQLDPIWVSTSGDQDLATSLRAMDKTDFFTKEIDTLLLEGKCRIAVHSAKDLPEPIPEGLRVVAVTRGVDPSDSLVFRKGESLASLPPGAKIATSSKRREASVRQLRADLEFLDLRGTIGQRLKKLDDGEADGVVVAEAALIRLGLTHLSRISLPGETVPGQGQLAILAGKDDTEMEALFSCLDARTKTLYLGLEPPLDNTTKKFVPFPVIKIVPRDPKNPEIKQAFQELQKYTHLIFTSKSTADIFFDILPHNHLIEGKSIIAVGKKTAKRIEEKGFSVDIVPANETAEGITQALKALPLQETYFFWPHSALSRPILSNFFKDNQIAYREVILYDTHPQQPGPLPNLETIDEILFTSPSTVDAFLQYFGELPKDKILMPIGPVTEQHLRQG